VERIIGWPLGDVILDWRLVEEKPWMAA